MSFDVLMITEHLDIVSVELASERALLWSQANMHIAEAMKISSTAFKVDDEDFEAVVYPFIRAGLLVALNGRKIFVTSNGRVSYFPDETELEGWKEKIQHLQTTHATAASEQAASQRA